MTRVGPRLVLFLALLGGCEASGGNLPGGPLPHDIDTVMGASCQQCHGDVPLYGAPGPLTRTEHFHRPSVSDPTRPVWALMAERLTSDTAPMPPPPLPRLDSHSTRTVLDWVLEGAPPALEEPGALAGSGAPRPPNASSIETTSTDDCEVSFELRAHGIAEPGDETPHTVTGPADFGRCFLFKAPAHGPVHATRIEAIVDNPRVVHHISIGAVEDPSEFSYDGKINICSPLEELVTYPLAFWLPGADDVEVPDGVGLRLPRGDAAYYLLQVHYSTIGGEHLDRSGMRICGKKDPMPEEASIHTLGSRLIDIPAGGTAEVSADCRVRGNEPVHVLSILPHMHLLGRRMTVEKLGTDGTVSMLHDQRFEFFSQLLYPVDWELSPGEGLRTTCYYENPTPFDNGYGEASYREMCYNFVVAYPVGALSDNPEGVEDNSCVAR